MFIDSYSDIAGISDNNCMNKKSFICIINNNHFDLLISKEEQSKYDLLETISYRNNLNNNR